MRAAAARTLIRSGRVALTDDDGPVHVAVDDDPVGVVTLSGRRWVATAYRDGALPAVVARRQASRDAAVRRLLMSQPASRFENDGRDPDD